MILLDKYTLFFYFVKCFLHFFVVDIQQDKNYFLSNIKKQVKKTSIFQQISKNMMISDHVDQRIDAIIIPYYIYTCLFLLKQHKSLTMNINELKCNYFKK